MTFDTQRLIPRCQHLIVDRAVDFVARGTPFAKGQMLDRKRTSLLLVTLKAGLVHIGHRSGRPGSCGRTMGIMAIGTGHMTFQDRVVMRKTEFGFLFHVAGEAHFRVFAGVDDLNALASPGFHVQARGAVAHLAAFHLDAFHRDSHSFMSGEFEILDLFGVTHAAGFGANVLGADHLMVFQDFLEGFNIHFTTGGKKKGTRQDQNR